MFDYLIHNARILDGSGAPARQGDVALSGRHIAAVGHLTDAEAAQVLDARGRYLTPGFLDIHRHADDALFRPGWGKAELAQGLTTVVNGNCGLSLAPVEGPHRGAAFFRQALPDVKLKNRIAQKSQGQGAQLAGFCHVIQSSASNQ